MITIREIALAVGFFIVAMSWIKALGRKARATGRITGFEWTGSTGYRVKKPRIRFQVEDREYSFLPSVYLRGDCDERRLGAEVEVAYNSSDPRDADLANRGRTYGPPVFLTLLYIIFLAFLLLNS
jgi:hypothetical protein